MRRALACFGALVVIASATGNNCPCFAQKGLAETLGKSAVQAFQAGKYREALSLCNQTADMQGLKPNDQLIVQIVIADCQRALGQYAESEQSYKKAFQMMDKLKMAESVYSMPLNNMALLYQAEGKLPEAEALWKRAEELSKKQKYDQTFPINNLARHYYIWGRLPEEEAYVKLSKERSEKYPKTIAHAYFLLNDAQLKEHKGHLKEANDQYVAALESCSKQAGPEHLYNNYILLPMSDLARTTGRYDLAEKALQAAIMIYEKQNPDHPEILETKVRMARVWCDQGKYAKAKELVESVLRKEQTIYGEKGNAFVARAQDCLGTIYRQDGRYDDAQKMLNLALENFKLAYGRDHVDTAVTMRHLAFVCEDQAEFEQAETLLKQSQQMIEGITGDENPQRAAAAVALARLYLREKKYDEAEPLFKKALDLNQRVLGGDNAATAAGAHDLGELYLKQNKVAEAQASFERALAADERIFGPKAAEVAADLTSLASALSLQGQTDKAGELLRRAADIKNVLPGGKPDDLTIPKAMVRSAQDRPVRDKWALVIGVSNFKDTSINLKYAAKDATDFKNFLINKEHFKNDHVKLLTDEQATRQNVLDMLGDKWLKGHAQEDDLVVVYVSSHGSASEDEVNANFLITHDTNKNSLAATGIPLQFLSKIIKDEVKSNRVVLILDVCHSGSAVEGKKGLERVRGVNTDAMNIGNGQMVICSSLSNQVSWESKNYANSVFTRNLIEALSQDSEKTTILDAYKRLKIGVESEVLRDRGNLQTPILNNKKWVGGDVVLGAE